MSITSPAVRIKIDGARGQRGFTGADGIEISGLLGVPAFSDDMGATPDDVLTDNGTAKQWFEELAATVEWRKDGAGNLYYKPVDALAPTRTIDTDGQEVISIDGATPLQLALRNASSTSERAQLAFGSSGSAWVFMKDQAANNGDDFCLWHETTGNTPFRFTDDEQMQTHWYNDIVNDVSAYDLAGTGVQVNSYNGLNSPAASSSIGLSAISNVYNTQAISGTYSEFSPVYTFLQGFTKHEGVTCVHANEHYIGYDNHLVTPHTTDPTQRAHAVVGMSYIASLYGKDAHKADADGLGAFMYSGVNKPLSEGELAYYGIAAGTGSEAFTAIYAASGFSGGPSITGGDQVGAGLAATYGFLAGNGGSGASGTFYLPVGTRSKFQFGGMLGDWTDAGLVIGNPIGTATLAGGRQYGIYNPYCAVAGGHMPSGQTVALYLSPSLDAHDGKQVMLSIGDSAQSGADGWSIGRDSGKSGANDLFFWSNTAAKNMFWMDDDKIGFFGAAPVARPTMWDVGGGAALADCVTAINRITLNLKNLGLFAAA